MQLFCGNDLVAMFKTSSLWCTSKSIWQFFSSDLWLNVTGSAATIVEAPAGGETQYCVVENSLCFEPSWNITNQKLYFFKKKIVNFFCKYFCKKKFVIFFSKKIQKFFVTNFCYNFFVVLNNLDNELYQSPARHCTHMRCCRYKVASTQCILLLIFPRFEGKASQSGANQARGENKSMSLLFHLFNLLRLFVFREKCSFGAPSEK